MDLSVVILNYNVRYLLESCIESVVEALKGLSAEVILIDNASTDQSVIMVREKYPAVKLLINDSNLGFAKANNLAIAQSTGQYILILNPDTIVNKSSIISALNYIKSHKDCGGVGVKMVDGSGVFLKESLRGFPDMASSLYKLSGINRLFPKSKIFNHYYLGHLDPDKVQEVEVLTGAFLMTTRKVFDAVNGFDESFFMFGEDIDLSVRIRQLGHKLIYLGDEQIVHLKGRSSANHSYTYVRDFYKAMSVFVIKYQKNIFIKYLALIGIYCSGLFSWVKRQVVKNFLPVSDFIILFGAIWCAQKMWAIYWFKDPDYFSHPAFVTNAAGYILIWMGALFFFDAYNPIGQRQIISTLKAIGFGTLVILLIYSLLPAEWRTSRAVIIWTTAALSIILPLMRRLLSTQGNGLRALVIGDRTQIDGLDHLLRILSKQNYFSYLTSTVIEGHPKRFFEEKWIDIQEKIKRENLQYVILGKEMAIEDQLFLSNKLIHQVNIFLEDKKQDEHILQGEIPGLVPIDLKLGWLQNRIVKKVIHVLTSILILPWGWMRNDIRKRYFGLLSGQVLWVGYADPANTLLPPLKPSLWHIGGLEKKSQPEIDMVNLAYARNYTVDLDIQIILKHIFIQN